MTDLETNTFTFLLVYWLKTTFLCIVRVELTFLEN